MGWCFLLAFPSLILSVAAYYLLLLSLVLRSLLHRWSSSSRGDLLGLTRIRIVFPPIRLRLRHDKMKDGMTWLILVSTTCCNLWEVPITTAFWIYSRTSSGEDEDPRNNILYTSNVQRPVNVIVVKKGRPIPRYQRRKEGIEQNLNSIPYCHTKRKKEKIAQWMEREYANDKRY